LSVFALSDSAYLSIKAFFGHGDQAATNKDEKGE